MGTRLVLMQRAIPGRGARFVLCAPSVLSACLSIPGVLAEVEIARPARATQLRRRRGERLRVDGGPRPRIQLRGRDWRTAEEAGTVRGKYRDFCVLRHVEKSLVCRRWRFLFDISQSYFGAGGEAPAPSGLFIQQLRESGYISAN